MHPNPPAVPPAPPQHPGPPSVQPREVTGVELAKHLQTAVRPVLVAFMAPWSRPCQAFESTLNELTAEFGPAVNILVISAEEHPDISLWYDIQSIPTLLCFVDGRVRARFIGALTKERIVSELQAIQSEVR